MHEKYTDRLREEYLKGRDDEREESKNKYDEYMENKYKSGYDDGYSKSCKDFADSNNLTNLYTTSYDEGYKDGSEDGYQDGWDAGYEEGFISATLKVEEYAENKFFISKDIIKGVVKHLEEEN